MIKVRNTTNQEIILQGRLLRETGQESDTYEIPALSIPSWADDDAVLSSIADGSVVVSLFETDITSVSKAIDTLKNVVPKEVNSISAPFSAKTIQGQKIFKRVHGVEFTLDSQNKDLDFDVPYPSCKITGVELVGAELGDRVDFKILDTETGTISGLSRLMLNQFGFGVCLNPGFHVEKSTYDADLIQDLRLRISFQTHEATPNRKIYINYILHEVK